MDATSLRQERDTYGNEKQTINGILGLRVAKESQRGSFSLDCGRRTPDHLTLLLEPIVTLLGKVGLNPI